MAAAIRLVLSISSALAVVAGCGSEDPPVVANDASQDSGTAGDGAMGDADASIELPDPNSQQCIDARAESFTPGDEADCWSQSDALEEGNCASNYCNWSQDQILCAASSPNVCGSQTALELGCTAEIQDKVAMCARMVVMQILAEATAAEDFKDETTACAKKALSGDVGDACLACYVDSSDCARAKCLGPCVNGDSRGCDDCQWEQGCLAEFWECTGFANPREFNPDGTER